MNTEVSQKIVETGPGFGASHRYSNNKGEISLVYPAWYTFNKFEIYPIKGELFEDIERYDSLEEAETRIKELLCPNT